jgi:CBS-domain-containing membrane protein
MPELMRTAPAARHLMRPWRVTLSPQTSMTAAAAALAASGAEAAPVVGADGRCVGVFTAGDYRRWLTTKAPVSDVFSEGQMVAADDRVCDHMSRRFATTGPDADARELLRRLAAAADPFLVVLDRRHRPVGVVCGLDVLVAESNGARADATPHLTR